MVEIDDSLVAFWSAYQVKLRLPSTPTAFIPQNFSILTPPTTPSEVPVNLNEGLLDIYELTIRTLKFPLLCKSFLYLFPSSSLPSPPSPPSLYLPPPPLFLPLPPPSLTPGDETGLSVWWLQDTQYQQPKMNMYCDINSAQTTYSLYDPQWTGTSIPILYFHILPFLPILTYFDNYMYSYICTCSYTFEHAITVIMLAFIFNDLQFH